MAILDGEFIDDKKIDPAKHRFIGTFREPFSAFEGMVDVFHCRCGENLFNQQAILEHWQRGHMDAPQYVTIGNLNESNFQQRHKCKGGIFYEHFGKEIDGTHFNCFESELGQFWFSVSNCEYAYRVNYCPYCGKKAPRQVGE